MKLNEISDNPGATKNRMRVGRGIGSGKGKTAGRGVKGQKSRTGVSINGFEGGQMAIYRRLPKRGFNNISRRDYVAINLDLLQAAVEAGKIAAGDKLDAAALVAKGVIRRARDGVRLLARGELKVALTLEVAGASEAAKAAVAQAGGSVVVAAAAAPAEG